MYRLHLDSESSVEIEVNSLSGYVIGKRIKTENTCDDEAAEELMRRTSCDGMLQSMKLRCIGPKLRSLVIKPIVL